MTQAPLRIVCMASANMEMTVPKGTETEPAIPKEVQGKKVPGCIITSLPEGDLQRFRVRLPHGDELVISPCIPSVRIAGSSINIGMMAGACGADVHAWLTVASDPFGIGMYHRLTQQDMWRVHNIRCARTPLTISLLGNGPTTLLMQKPTPTELALTKEICSTVIDGVALTQPRIIFATSVGESELALVRSLFEQRDQAFRVFCPRVSILGEPRFTEDLLHTMAAADMVVMNRREYRCLTGEYEMDAQFQASAHMPCIIRLLAPKLCNDQRQRLFVVTCDTDGASAVAHTAGNIDGIHDIAALTDVDAKDTTGAGDAFALGMALGLNHGLPWTEAMQWGARLATANITGIGGWWAADEKNPHRVTPTFFN